MAKFNFGVAILVGLFSIIGLIALVLMPFPFGLGVFIATQGPVWGAIVAGRKKK